MRVSARTDYAVRACLVLARAEGAVVPAERIAAEQSIPQPFLLGILGDLRRAGVVESRRGVDGGYRLPDPADVCVADVVRALDGPLATVAGVPPEDVDLPARDLAVRDTWVALRVALRSVLEEVTLADLAAGALPGPVRDLLDVPDAWEARPWRRVRGGRSGQAPPRASASAAANASTSSGVVSHAHIQRTSTRSGSAVADQS